MADQKSDQRSLQRLALQVPAAVKYTNGGVHEAECVTKNVSAAGVFLYMDVEPKIGSEIELVLNLPAQDGTNSQVQVHCVAKVVRVERGDLKYGVAASITSYEIAGETTQTMASS
jgi:hypothetical protein